MHDGSVFSISLGCFREPKYSGKAARTTVIVAAACSLNVVKSVYCCLAHASTCWASCCSWDWPKYSCPLLIAQNAHFICQRKSPARVLAESNTFATDSGSMCFNGPWHGGGKGNMVYIVTGPLRPIWHQEGCAAGEVGMAAGWCEGAPCTAVSVAILEGFPLDLAYFMLGSCEQFILNGVFLKHLWRIHQSMQLKCGLCHVCWLQHSETSGHAGHVPSSHRATFATSKLLPQRHGFQRACRCIITCLYLTL